MSILDDRPRQDIDTLFFCFRFCVLIFLKNQMLTCRFIYIYNHQLTDKGNWLLTDLSSSFFSSIKCAIKGATLWNFTIRSIHSYPFWLFEIHVLFRVSKRSDNPNWIIFSLYYDSIVWRKVLYFNCLWVCWCQRVKYVFSNSSILRINVIVLLIRSGDKLRTCL